MTSCRRIAVPGLVCSGTSALQKLLTGQCVYQFKIKRQERLLTSTYCQYSVLDCTVWQAQSAIAAYIQLGFI